MCVYIWQTSVPFPASCVPKVGVASSPTTTTTARIGWPSHMAVPLAVLLPSAAEAPLSSVVTQAYRWVTDGAFSNGSFIHSKGSHLYVPPLFPLLLMHSSCLLLSVIFHRSIMWNTAVSLLLFIIFSQSCINTFKIRFDNLEMHREEAPLWVVSSLPLYYH